MTRDWRLLKAPVLFLVCFVFWCGCHSGIREPQGSNSAMPQRDINTVLRAHDQELMAIPGVVGVYVGLLADERTPCLKVMVVKKTGEVMRALPKTLGGYRVEVEETGQIRPMGSG